MASVSFSPHLHRHLELEEMNFSGRSVREVIDKVVRQYPKLNAYILDDQGGLRKHVVVFIDGQMILDKVNLSDPVHEGSELFIAQALSGG